MSDDITFCGNECNNTRCRRHRSNIKEPQYPHSVALLEGTEYCEKKHKPTSVRLIDAEALKKCAIPCEIHNGALTDLCVPLYQIDNAPTVETTKVEHKAYNEGFKDGVDQGIKLSERPQGDLISRETLKGEIAKATYNFEQIPIRVDKVQEIIDNAPTVEPRIEYGADGQPYRLFMSGGQVVPDMLQGWRYEERPHGEWITSKIDGEKYNCSECGGSCWYYDYQGNVSKSNFCPNCGAYMVDEH